MIIAIREDGEVRIFESEEEVLREWGRYPRDVESDVVVFYSEDGAWLKPVFAKAARSGPTSFRLVLKAADDTGQEDPIGLAVYEARTLVLRSSMLRRCD